MKLASGKRKWIVGGVAAAMLAGAVGAFAFFTSTGSGDGSGTTGSATAFAVSVGTTTTPPLFPDATGTATNVQTVTYTVTNNSAGHQQVNTVHIAIQTTGGGVFTSTNPSFSTEAACTAADYSLDNRDPSLSATGIDDPNFTAVDLAPGASTSGSVTLEMIDNGAPQDNCQGVTVPIHVSVS